MGTRRNQPNDKTRINKMNKLLDAYKAQPTATNAKKVQVYNRKHPMAVALLATEDMIIYNAAMNNK